MNNPWLAVCACPLCQEDWLYQAVAHAFSCPKGSLTYIVTKNMPVMIAEKAHQTSLTEYQMLAKTQIGCLLC